MAGQTSNTDQFEVYFQRADVDRDGRISGSEAVSFLQASNLPRPVLAQIWTYADQNRSGFLSRSEFYNALKLVTVAQSKRDLTPEIVKAALYGPASAKIPPPQINLAATQGPHPNVMPSPSTAQSGGIGAIRPPGVLDQPSLVTRPPRPPLPSSGLQSYVSSTHGLPGKGSTSVPNLPGVASSSQASGTSLVPSTVQGSLPRGGSLPSHSKTPEVSPVLQSATSMPNIALSNSQAGKEDNRSPSATGNGFASGFVPGADALTSSRDQHSVKQIAVGPTPSAQPLPVNVSGKASQHVSHQAQTPSEFSAQSPWPRMTQSDVQKYSKVFMQVDADRDGKITGEQARNLFLSWKLPREVLKQVWDLSDQDNDSMLSLREFCIALYLMERFREGRSLPRVLPNSIMFDETSLHASGQPTVPYGNSSWRPSPGFQQPQGTRNIRPITSVAGGKPPRPVPVPQPDEPIQQKPKIPELEKHLVDQLSTEEQDSLNKKFQEAKDAETKVADLEKEILEAKQKIQFYHAKMQELILYKSRCDSRLNEISEKVVGDKREAEALAKKYEEKYKQVGDVASKLTIEEATFREIQEKKMKLYLAIVKLEQENADSVKDQANQILSDLEELVKALNEQCKTYRLRAKPTTLVELPFGWQRGIEATAADWDDAWDKFEDEGYTYAKELTLDIENVTAPHKPKTPLVREKVIAVDERGAKSSPSKVNDPSEQPSSEEMIHENERLNVHNTKQTAKSPPDSPATTSEAGSPYKNLPQLRMPKQATFDGSPRAFDTQSEFGGTESVGIGFDEPAWGSFDTRFDSGAAWDYDPVTPMGAEQERNGEGSSFGVDDWGLNPIKTGSTGITAKQGPFFDSVPSTPLYSSANSPQKRQSPFFDSVPSTPLYGSANSPQKRQSPFFDSVPSTPLYSSANSPQKRQSPFFDSVPSTPLYGSANSPQKRQSPFFDSVPSTPLYNSANSPQKRQSPFFDSVPSTPAYGNYSGDNMFAKDSRPYAFADSVPSTPMHNSNFTGSSEEQYSFENSFSRFDSFNINDSGPFDSSLSRFDSMRSTRDSEFDRGSSAPQDSFARFDSFRSTADSDYNFGLFPPLQSMLTRYDSTSSTRDSEYGHGFASFDDTADPFGSSDPFRSSHEAQTPKKDSNSWSAF